MKRILIYFCLLVLFIPAINAQDILVLKNGEVKTVYNVEIGKESIFYTTENKHGATIHKIGKMDVFTIKKNDEVALAEDEEVREVDQDDEVHGAEEHHVHARHDALQLHRRQLHRLGY